MDVFWLKATGGPNSNPVHRAPRGVSAALLDGRGGKRIQIIPLMAERGPTRQRIASKGRWKIDVAPFGFAEILGGGVEFRRQIQDENLALSHHQGVDFQVSEEQIHVASVQGRNKMGDEIMLRLDGDRRERGVGKNVHKRNTFGKEKG